MKGVILAGGSGTRLHPVTLEIPKPLLTVKRKPILNHLLELFGKHGVNQPIVVINKNHSDDYKWWQKRYQKELPKNLKVIVEPKPLGTFGGMKYLRRDLKEPFILSNGDALYNFNLKELIKAHKNNPTRPIATIALTRVENPSDYGVPVMKGSQINEFLEKPSISGHRKTNGLAMSKKLNLQSRYISSGLYILEPEVFQYADFSKPGSESSTAAQQLKNNGRTSTTRKGYLMIEKDIFPKLARDGKLAGHKVKNGKWQDCGTFARWEKAINEWG